MHTADGTSAGGRPMLGAPDGSRTPSSDDPRTRESHGFDLDLYRRAAGWSALLLLAVVVAWMVTADQMEGMDAGPGSDLGAFGWFVGIWAVMMAAMMLPPAAPMILRYARSQAERRSTPAAIGPTLVFTAAYMLVWIAVGAAAYAGVELVRSLAPDFLDWSRAGQYVAGGVIVFAA